MQISNSYNSRTVTDIYIIPFSSYFVSSKFSLEYNFVEEYFLEFYNGKT